MPKFNCRYNNKHEYRTEEEQLSHEKICPDKKNRPDLKLCPYTDRHILKVTMYEKHIKNCKYKKQVKKEEKSNQISNNIDDGWGDVNRNINININTNHDSIKDNNHNMIKVETDENYEIDEDIFEEDDFIFKQCYV